MSTDTFTVSEYEAIKRQFNARKGQVTLKRRSLQKTLDKVKAQDSWTQFSEEQLRTRVADMQVQLKQLEELANNMQMLLSHMKADAGDEEEEAEPPRADSIDAEMQEVWNQYVEYQEAFDEIAGLAMDVLNDLRKGSQARPTQETPSRGGNGTKERYKDNSSMKPEKLTAKHSMTWFTEWKRKMKAYVTSSNMEGFPMAKMPIAHEYILSCLGDDLVKVIRPRVSDHLLIYSHNRHTKGLIDIIEEEFLREYPMLMRRLKLFNIQQEQNESFADYHTRLLTLAEEAAYDDITPEKLKSMLLLIGLRDKKTREHLMLQNTDNYTELRDCGLKYQAISTANNRLYNNNANTSNVYPRSKRGRGGGSRGGGNQQSGGNRQSFGNRQTNGNQNQGNGNKGGYKGPPLKDGKCTACGRNGGCQELRDGCKARGHKCKCNKQGHFEKYCYNKNLWPKGAHATDIQDGQEGASANGDGGG